MRTDYHGSLWRLKSSWGPGLDIQVPLVFSSSYNIPATIPLHCADKSAGKAAEKHGTGEMLAVSDAIGSLAPDRLGQSSPSGHSQTLEHMLGHV
jgi:hypothetical protein